MSNESYHWLVDRQEFDQNRGSETVEIVQDGLDMRLQHMAFGQFAAVSLAHINTLEPFKFSSSDASHGRSGPAIWVMIPISGRANGKMPGMGSFVLDVEWGLLTDLSEGNADFLIEPGEPVRVLSGSLSIDQIRTLFHGEGFDAELDAITQNRGLMKSFLVTPAMRQIVDNAFNTQLAGPLKRLFLEGAVLQLFALVFQHELLDPVTGRREVTQAVAQKRALEQAAKLLTEDLSAPRCISEISRATGLSQYRLRQGFKELFGCTMLEMLTRKRLQTARDLLTERPDYPLKALAGDVGYAHQSNFTIAFKREFGSTPGEHVKRINGSG